MSRTASPFREYLNQLEANLRGGIATEESHRPALVRLVESLGNVQAVNEPKRVACGAPDLAVQRRTGNLDVTIGYIETKDIGSALEEAERSEQLRRYRNALPNLLLTDYLQFRWYVDGALRATGQLATLDENTRQMKPLPNGETQVAQLLTDFLSHTPQPVADPNTLAQRMARYAHLIRDIVVETFQQGQASDLLHDLRRAFAETLLPDLDKPEHTAEFADMLAQTFAYGLFAARCAHTGSEPFRRVGAAAEIPKTSPFLRRLFETLAGTDLDEEPFAGFVDDLAHLLAVADMPAILKDFGKRTRQEDPVVHFYETFLQAYDPRLRELRGVYYTPEPVVAYLVSSVHRLLQKHFGIAEGLATTPASTGAAKGLYILDPACGTGTFLSHIVQFIREELRSTGRGGLWNAEMAAHLLQRLFGFELLMAPYAIAHLKLGLQLSDVSLPENQRLGIYLTNTLEMPSGQIALQIGPWRVISEEAQAASDIKGNTPILVVIGNPPYSANSANKIAWIEQRIREDYYPRDAMREQNPKLLLDDYVKFIRWAQWRLERTGQGILAFITNHGYLDNPTFRGMRRALMEAFDLLYVLDLHGNVRKKERAPDGSPDENVFDIQQGVALLLAVKLPQAGEKAVYHYELYGSRESKYEFLSGHDATDTPWRTLNPQPPLYLFLPQDAELQQEYEQGWKVTDIFPVYSTGIKTHRDHFVFDFDRAALEQRIRHFRDLSIPDEKIRQQYGLKDTRDWKLSENRKALAQDPNWQSYFHKCLYRPFDVRELYYTPRVVELDRYDVMRHMLVQGNRGLVTCRQLAAGTWQHVLVANTITDDCYISTRTRERGYMFPLYLHPNDREAQAGVGVHPNLNPDFVTALSQATGSPQPPIPEEVFAYIYAVLHSPTYRTRYAESLRRDFPRIPLPRDGEEFQHLVALGQELIDLHLLEAPALRDPPVKYPVQGTDVVEKGFPRYDAPVQGVHEGRVWINEKQYLEGAPESVWEFHIGGYQVAHKWLKDRVGRKLSIVEIETYRKILYALRETIRVMEKIG